MEQALALRSPGKVVFGRRVWCWDDLWREVALSHPSAPARLSPAGVRAAIGEAIDRARRAGELGAVREIADSPGFRRRLRGRFAAWTREDRPPGANPPDNSAVGVAEWNLYRHYRNVLRRLGAEDPEGSAGWASGILLDGGPPPALSAPGSVTVLEPMESGRAIARGLEFLVDRAESTLVTLPWDPDPALAEVYAPVARLRDRFLEWGFDEESFPLDPDRRPAGLLGVEAEVFRIDAHRRPKLGRADGLAILGAPQGEGLAMVLARRVRELLEDGADPAEVLILSRRGGEAATLAAETLEAWGIPVAEGSGRPLAGSTAVSALVRAIVLPAEGWEAAGLIRLLRNSRVRPGWATPPALAVAATALREGRVFRGREAIREALGRQGQVVESDPNAPEARARSAKAGRAREAGRVVGPLFDLFAITDRPAPWGTQVVRLRRIAAGLGLDEGEGASDLEDLGNALDDQGAVLDGLGQGEVLWSWAEFAREVQAIVRDLDRPAPSPAPGSIRIANVDDVEGARARHVLLIDLAEGSFPTRDSIEPDPAIEPGPEPEPATEGEGPGPPARASLAFGREMLRFLRVVGSADETLDLLHPTTDEKAQPLLAAGFLLDARRLFDDRAASGFPKPIRRLDPALLLPGLDGSPSDARVRAIARALHEGDAADLTRLARSPAHRGPLLGTAAALEVAHRRFRRTGDFGPYEGRIREPGAVARIASSFPEFSPSQLESLVFCPFQFFAKFVLRLEPIDERDELDDDRTSRGSLIHRILERLHLGLRDPSPDVEVVAGRIEGAIRRTLDEEPSPRSAVEFGIRAIETARLERTGRRYARQFAAYLEQAEGPIESHRVEVEFGATDGRTAENPALTLGEGDDVVILRGKIDRVDLIRDPDRPTFRVIDYKTGASPTKKQVREGIALQLPLYTLAVERMNLFDDGALPRDVGYWTLRESGFKSVKLDDWEAFRNGLERFVLELVAGLRRGDFPVQPRQDPCETYCDYRAICRIAQVRAAGKVGTPLAILDLDGETRP